MADIQQPIPQPTAQPQVQPAAGPPAAPPVVIPKPPRKIPVWLIALAVVTVGLIVILAVGKMITKPQVTVAPTPTPAPTVVPTPIRSLSPFATTSAFMSLDSAVISFSTAVKAYNTSDPILVPPVLDLNIGF